MLAGLIFCLALFPLGHASADTGVLVVNSYNADPAPRAAWQAAVDRFQRENPDLSVELNIYDHGAEVCVVCLHAYRPTPTSEGS